MDLDTFLGTLTIERGLDVATGQGTFLRRLASNLAGYKGLIGIDLNDAGAEAFEAALSGLPKVSFQKMDAASMDFPNATFDLVSLTYSMHHMADISVVFEEMKRVTKPSGVVIVLEMTADGNTETQMTHVLLHHWWAEIDRGRDVYHDATWLRSDILAALEFFNFQTLLRKDVKIIEEDPLNPEVIQFLNTVIDRYLTYAQVQPDSKALLETGDVLRERLKTIGFHNASVLVWVGRKPDAFGPD